MSDRRSGMMKGVRILCALALLLVGFAHKVPVLDGYSVQSAGLSQYAFPDGSPHDLCLPGEAGGAGHSHPGFGSGCEACRLSASILAPAPGDAAGWLIRLPVDRFMPKRVGTFHRPFLLPNAAPRGPPSRPTAGKAAVAQAAAIPVRAG